VWPGAASAFISSLTFWPASGLIFSVGLIEHFDPPGASQFPYPTWLYRATRELQHFGHSRQFLAQFGECRPYIHSGYTPLCMRRNREEAEAESLPRRKVLARRQALNAAG